MKGPKYDHIENRDKSKHHKSDGLATDCFKLSHKMVKDSLDKQFGKSEDDRKYDPTQISWESISTY